MTDLPTAAQLDALKAAGVVCFIHVDGAAGGRDVPANNGEEALLAARDPVAATAAYWEVSVDQIREWKATDRMARCGGNTRNDQPCQAVISGELDPGPWAALHRQGYCAAHERFG